MSATRAKTIVISGAGIAGPTLAYWLARARMTPVIVEATPALRTGGYMIDFWGLGFAVAEAMGLGDRVRQAGYDMRELRLLDDEGRTMARLETDAMRKAIGDRYVSLLRGDLARELSRAVEDHVETMFGNAVTSLSQDPTGVDVGFAHGPPRRFDLVVGADGVHSNIRRLAFGADDHFEIALGYCFAAFTARDFPRWNALAYVSRTTPGRQVVCCSLKDGRTVFFMILASELADGYVLATIADQKRCLTEIFAGIGWGARDILDALERADDLFFDSVSQVQMPTWSRGRVALVGDAAYCPSFLAGEGASFAMAGAYILAGELAESGTDHTRAFLGYERRFKPFVDRKQRSARRLGGWFAPRTPVGLFARNQLTRLAAIPVLSRLMVGPIVADPLALPEYHWDGALATGAPG